MCSSQTLPLAARGQDGYMTTPAVKFRGNIRDVRPRSWSLHFKPPFLTLLPPGKANSLRGAAVTFVDLRCLSCCWKRCDTPKISHTFIFERASILQMNPKYQNHACGGGRWERFLLHTPLLVHRCFHRLVGCCSRRREAGTTA